MKIGVRKPSLKKSIKARTTAKVKRQVKSTINPMYGKKGMGWVNDPEKALYNKVYNKTTVSARDIIEHVVDREEKINYTTDNILTYIVVTLVCFIVGVAIFF